MMPLRASVRDQPSTAPEYIHVDFIGWLRGQEKFEAVDELVAQMHIDADNARSVLAASA
jgi:FAD synthase